ncbi:FAD-dependent oxidoreductase [Pseudonocardia sp. H11422]|uniref:FAD-dependent oxidoreductase n=1 Tax=Pseudonocardia sp. H11422 TaxID=2835866 RepID=UPI001BDD2335|nr:FAD-dependent oxidoreductase [Pseudonocardia sp. H11422]
MKLFGNYDVVVVGAGMTGVVSGIVAARRGARTLVVESSGLIGGLVTGGRLTKPTGLVQGGVYRELIDRAVGYGGADAAPQRSYWGAYTGVFDAEVMQRVIIEALEESGAELLLFASVTDVVRDGNRVSGVVVQTKAGPELVTGTVVIDATGDGDVATLAGAEFMIGRDGDGHMQPMTSYFRILNVDFPALVADLKDHPEDVAELVLPDSGRDRNESYALTFFMTGLSPRIKRAQEEGFNWIVPRDNLTVKAGMLPGEINVNVTRVQGNALDPRVRSQAVIEIRKQAYCAFDFLKQYLGGFENAILLDVAPVLGVRETRRIRGDYVLTEDDVRNEARFDDAIGLCNAPMDIHEPGGNRAIMINVGSGYGIPFRCLLPADLEGLLIAGRCLSVDHMAFASTRNTPACALTGQAAGIAAAEAVSNGVSPRAVPVAKIQAELTAAGIVLGTHTTDFLDETS